MIIMACHLALNSKGALTGARSAVSQPDENWTCFSCGCPLILHPGDRGEHPWFEHDTQSAKGDALMHCQYRIHRDGLPGERFRVMLHTVYEQDIRMTVHAWHCVWCGHHYEGEKHCTTCNTGIYSIEDCPADNPDDRRSPPFVSGGC